MSQRPESVTVIAWLLIVFGAFGLLGCMASWSMRDLPVLQPLLGSYRIPYGEIITVAMVNVTIHLVCGASLLLRQSWARHVYLATALLMIGFSAWVNPWPLFVLVPSLLFPLLATVLMYRPEANRWFASEDVAGASA